MDCSPAICVTEMPVISERTCVSSGDNTVFGAPNWKLHSDEQPSFPVALPSSHCSGGSRVPLPQLRVIAEGCTVSSTTQ